MLEEYCKIEGDDFVIRMPVSALVSGVLHSEYADRARECLNGMDYNPNYWKVIDEKILTQDLISSLTEESENGSSILSDAFDKSFEKLMEYAYSDGIETADD